MCEYAVLFLDSFTVTNNLYLTEPLIDDQVNFKENLIHITAELRYAAKKKYT